MSEAAVGGAEVQRRITGPEVRAAKPEDHLAVADVLRVTAIGLVVLSHFVLLGTVLQPLFDGLTSLGCWGVDAFFILSGFLLGQSYVAALLTGTALPTWQLYARRRFLRIWPAYAVVVIISAALVAVHRGHETTGAADIVAHLLMIHGFSTAWLFGAGNSALWTMAVDAQFYVLLPLGAVAASLLMARVDERRRPAALAIVIASIIACSVAARLVASTLPFDWNADSAMLYAVQRNALGMACAFGAGLLLAVAFVRDRALEDGPWPTFLVVALASEAFSMNFAWWWPGTNSAIRLLVYDVCGTFSASCTLLAALALRKHSNRFARLVENRFVAGAALMAYAVYLVHYPVRQAAYSVIFERYHVPPKAPTFVVLLVAGALPVIASAAYLLHRFVERPFLKRKERFRDPQRVAVPRL